MTHLFCFILIHRLRDSPYKFLTIWEEITICRRHAPSLGGGINMGLVAAQSRCIPDTAGKPFEGCKAFLALVGGGWGARWLSARWTGTRAASWLRYGWLGTFGEPGCSTRMRLDLPLRLKLLLRGRSSRQSATFAIASHPEFG